MRSLSMLCLLTACSPALPQIAADEARCGDGKVQAPEICDDGNELDDDACLQTCQPARCGDGHLRSDLSPGTEGAEECDDGNINDRDACTNSCSLAICGDGLRRADLFAGSQSQCCGRGQSTCPPGESCIGGRCWLETYEHCDDGNDDDNDGCTRDCLAPSCGDGFVQTGEGCDDGNCADTDACSSSCALARCGDGLLQDGVEECEDGNQSPGDGCDAQCLVEGCGNGRLDLGEACDDLALTAQGGCVDCQLGVCGDGVVHQGQEACDDGNLLPGDDCSVDCRVDDHGDNFETATPLSLEAYAVRGARRVVSGAEIHSAEDTDVFELTADSTGIFLFQAKGLGLACNDSEDCRLHESCTQGYCQPSACSDQPGWGLGPCPQDIPCVNGVCASTQTSPDGPRLDPSCRLYSEDRRLAGFQDDRGPTLNRAGLDCNVEIHLETGEKAYLAVDGYDSDTGPYHVFLLSPCGNGLLDEGEECDPDSEDSNYYRCRADCRARRRLAMAGGTGCVAVDGAVNCWGSNATHVLGDFEQVPQEDRLRCQFRGGQPEQQIDAAARPVQVVQRRFRVQDLSGGWSENICALYGRDGHAYCWGREGDSRQETDNRLIEAADWTWCAHEPQPQPDPFREGRGFSPGSCLATPTVYGLGEVNFGDEEYPDRLAGVEGVTVGAISKCLILGGQARCWGHATNGVLGVENLRGGVGMGTPTAIAMPEGTHAVFIAIGTQTACAILDRGELACWGRNDFGQTGSGLNQEELPASCNVNCDRTPQYVDAELAYIVHVAVGGDHSCALDFRGQVFCWGKNDAFQTGVASDPAACGETACVRRPMQVPNLTGIADIALGAQHSCALTSRGEVLCWGNNSLGQLGMGTLGPIVFGGSHNLLTPARVGRIPAVTAITAGRNSNCARTAENRVYCWGENDTGQLGSGTCGAPSAFPMEVDLEF